MKHARTILPLVLVSLLCVGCSTQTRTQPHAHRFDARRVAAVLDFWHTSAAEGAFDSYFGAMTEDSVFLGTDASERWSKAEFMEYAREPFSDGNGWTYTASDRFISFDDDGDTAWVDEIMTNAKYGKLRGTAVLGREDEAWKIAHYSLTFLVPNDKAGEVVDIIADD